MRENSDVLKGRVRVTYWADGDSSWLLAGSNRFASANAMMAGHGPTTVPVAQLNLFLLGGEADVVARGQQPPVVTLVTDDSVARELSPIKFGTFVAYGPTAPPAWVVRVPLSAELDPANFVALARSRHATIRVGTVPITLRDSDRRDIGALYIAMVCGTP